MENPKGSYPSDLEARIISLKRSASTAARTHGHRLDRFRHPFNSPEPLAVAYCARCSFEARVELGPLGLEIAGRALEMPCEAVFRHSPGLDEAEAAKMAVAAI